MKPIADKKHYKIIWTGPKRAYPTIHLSVQFAKKIIGRYYTEEMNEAGEIILRPVGKT